MTTSIPKNRHPIIRPSATHFRLTLYLFSRLPFVIISTWTCLLSSSQLPDVLFEIIPDRWRSSPVVVPTCVIVHYVPIISHLFKGILEVDRPFIALVLDFFHIFTTFFVVLNPPIPGQKKSPPMDAAKSPQEGDGVGVLFDKLPVAGGPRVLPKAWTGLAWAVEEDANGELGITRVWINTY